VISEFSWRFCADSLEAVERWLQREQHLIDTSTKTRQRQASPGEGVERCTGCAPTGARGLCGALCVFQEDAPHAVSVGCGPRRELRGVLEKGEHLSTLASAPAVTMSNAAATPAIAISPMISPMA